MMYKLISLFIFFSFAIPLNLMEVLKVANAEDHVIQDALKLRINAVNGGDCLLNEPVYLEIELSNCSKLEVNYTASLSFSDSDIYLEVKDSESNIKKFTGISTLKLGTNYLKPLKLSSNGKITETQALNFRISEFFSNPGNYELRIVLLDQLNDKKVISNWLKINVLKPIDTDLKAYQFLKGLNGDCNLLLGPSPGNFECFKLKSEEFIRLFPDSKYCEYILFNLGRVFFYQKDYFLSTQCFNKLKLKKNRALDIEAEKYINEINRLKIRKL